MKFEIEKGENTVNAEILENKKLQLDDRIFDYEWIPQKDGSITAQINQSFYKLYNVQVDGSKVSFQHKGEQYEFKVKDEMALLMEKMGFKDVDESSAGQIKAPMPGKIVKFLINEGDPVKEGEPVVILEAMKMENELKTTVSGTVVKFTVEAGSSVEKNEVILEIE